MPRARSSSRLVLLSALFAGGSVGYWYYHHPQSLTQQVKRLEEDKRQLQQIVQRLTDERRVAEMIVTEQRKTDAGGTETTLLFVEQARDGSPLPAKSFTVQGDEVWLAGLSIRFEQGFVEKGDALRGHGIMLFTKLFGQDQTPAQGQVVDEPGKIPDIYRGDPKEVARVSEFERELWQDFWRLVDDKSYRAAKGVATAGGKAVFFKAQPDRLYRVTLDVSGNPSVEWETIKPIYREAMRKANGAAAAGANVQ